MFLDLINLYNKNSNSNKTPLEDFNTECFANILRLFEIVKKDFIYNFLKLPEDKYVIKTQLKKDLPNNPNCIIDLVFIGNKNICFIENKVESSEGHEQLSRYCKVLDIHFDNLKKYLFYCTKYTDPKNRNKEFKNYNFKQFKWFEIAKFLKKYSNENPIIKDYILFLNHFKMAQDNTFKVENLLTLENMMKTIEIVEFHIDNCKFEFNTFFGYEKYNSNFNWNQLKNHNRISHYNSGILISQSNKYSEVLYSIELGDLTLSTHIYVNSDHEQYEQFKAIDLENFPLKCRVENWGTSIYMKEDLGKFLNNENSDKLIKDWFLNSFEILKTLISNNSQLDWR
ncbi:PD-(D/E)XK nuclease family protein [Flavobacterium covae]